MPQTRWKKLRHKVSGHFSHSKICEKGLRNDYAHLRGSLAKFSCGYVKVHGLGETMLFTRTKSQNLSFLIDLLDLTRITLPLIVGSECKLFWNILYMYAQMKNGFKNG